MGQLEDYLDDEGEDNEDVDADVEDGPDPDVLYEQYREARLFGI